MSKNLNPDVCEVSGFDFSTVPKLGPNLEGLGDDLTGYLCNILKLSQREALDPVLREATPYDNSVWISALTGMQGVGDPRLSMGELMTVALERYLKPLSIQLQVLQEGCHVTNGVLCDADGKEIPFYGKCETPDTEMFTYDSITSYVTDVWLNALDKHANDFVDFLNENYLTKGWDIELHTLSDGDLEKIKKGGGAPVFYVKLTKKGESKPIYYKYYFDKKDYVSNALGKPLIVGSPKKLQTIFLQGLGSDEGFDMGLMDVISGPMWPEKNEELDEDMEGLNSLFKPDKLYVNISFSQNGRAAADIYMSNEKWDGLLPTQVPTGNRLISYPKEDHITPINFGDQDIIISPYNNGSFCVVFFDRGRWDDWEWNRVRFWRDSYSRYAFNILLKAGNNKFKTVIKDINIAKFERTYNGASGSASAPCKIGYSQGYGSQQNSGPDRVTCYVVTNVWSVLTPKFNWLGKQ